MHTKPWSGVMTTAGQLLFRQHGRLDFAREDGDGELLLRA